MAATRTARAGSGPAKLDRTCSKRLLVPLRAGLSSACASSSVWRCQRVGRPGEEA